MLSRVFYYLVPSVIDRLVLQTNLPHDVSKVYLCLNTLGAELYRLLDRLKRLLILLDIRQHH